MHQPPRLASSAPPAPERFEPVAGLLAIALPGAGHLYLGERRRAALIAGGILGLFVAGLLLGGIDVVDRREDRVWFLAQAMVGPIAFLADYVHQEHLKVKEMGPGGRLVYRSATPQERRSGGVYASRSVGRMNELGTLYTAIAGMLNLIAILDAMFHRAGGGWGPARAADSSAPRSGGAVTTATEQPA